MAKLTSNQKRLKPQMKKDVAALRKAWAEHTPDLAIDDLRAKSRALFGITASNIMVDDDRICVIVELLKGDWQLLLTALALIEPKGLRGRLADAVFKKLAEQDSRPGKFVLETMGREFQTLLEHAQPASSDSAPAHPTVLQHLYNTLLKRNESFARMTLDYADYLGEDNRAPSERAIRPESGELPLVVESLVEADMVHPNALKTFKEQHNKPKKRFEFKWPAFIKRMFRLPLKPKFSLFNRVLRKTAPPKAAPVPSVPSAPPAPLRRDQGAHAMLAVGVAGLADRIRVLENQPAPSLPPQAAAAGDVDLAATLSRLGDQVSSLEQANGIATQEVATLRGKLAETSGALTVISRKPALELSADAVSQLEGLTAAVRDLSGRLESMNSTYARLMVPNGVGDFGSGDATYAAGTSTLRSTSSLLSTPPPGRPNFVPTPPNACAGSQADGKDKENAKENAVAAAPQADGKDKEKVVPLLLRFGSASGMS